jgi:hypothetical protein
MAPRNAQNTIPDTQIALSVKCEAPKANKTITLRATINEDYYCEWLCTLANKSPQLEIFLQWSIADGCERYHPPPAGVQALRIVSRSGQHLFYDKIDGVKSNTPLFGNVSCLFRLWHC